MRFIQDLQSIRSDMGEVRSAKPAVLMVLLFICSTHAFSIQPQEYSSLSDETHSSYSSSKQTMNLSLNPASSNTDFNLILPEGEPLLSASIEIEPYALPMHSGFTWDDSSIWSHSDATNGGVSIQGSTMTGTSSGTLWDFNSGSQGWAFSGYGARVTSPTCGLNGSTGGSIRTYAGSSESVASCIACTIRRAPTKNGC